MRLTLWNLLSLVFIACGIYYFFVSGPSEAELQTSHDMFVKLLCKSEIVSEVKAMEKNIEVIRERTVTDLALGGQGMNPKVLTQVKQIYTTANTAMEEAGVTLQTIKRLLRLKEVLYAEYIDTVSNTVIETCPDKVRRIESVKATMEALFILIPKGAYIY